MMKLHNGRVYFYHGWANSRRGERENRFCQYMWFTCFCCNCLQWWLWKMHAMDFLFVLARGVVLFLMYGQLGNRWIDFQRSYWISKSILHHIFKEKLQMFLTARSVWPLYVTHREDTLFRKQTWDDDFNWEDAESMPHHVMHDNTDIWLMCPTNTQLQWALYSRYYAGYIAKGVVAIHPCGWIATWELCTGGIGDSRYVRMVNFSEKQQQYAQYDDETKHHPFTNIFDRGYCVVLDGVKCGKQICI